MKRWLMLWKRRWIMLPVNLNLKDCPVLIVGAGTVGRRKADQFVKEGAHVAVLAPEIADNFNPAVQRLEKWFEDSDLNGYFLVWAATDNLELNERLCKLCREKGILCGSATANEALTCSSMAVRQCGTITAALSSGMPELSRQLLDEIEPLIKEKEAVSQLMKPLRNLIQKRVSDSDQRRELLLRLPRLTADQLMILKRAAESGEIWLAFWHGVKESEAAEPIRQLYRKCRLVPVFVSETAYAHVHSQIPELFSMSELSQFLNPMGIEVQGVPMVLQKGKVTAMIRAAFPNAALQPALMDLPEWTSGVLTCFEQLYPHCRLLFVVHSQVPESCPPNWITMVDLEAKTVSRTDQVIPFFLLAGKHLRRDVAAVCLRLGMKYIEQRALMEISEIMAVTCRTITERQHRVSAENERIF